MASIFRQSYTKVDPKTGERKTHRSKKYYVKYKDEDGILRRVPGFADKEATRQLAAQLEREVARRQSGLTDRTEDERRRPIADHVAAFRRHLEAKENTETYVDMRLSRLETIVKDCRFRRVDDIQAGCVQEWLAEKRRDGLAARTVNFYLSTIKAFTRWLVRERRLPENPLSHLSALNAATDTRRARRGLPDAEFADLLRATEDGGPFRGLDGRARRMLYLTAANTGFRKRELRSLTPAAFDLEGKTPTVTVAAGYSKHRREDTQPLRRDVATELKAWLSGHPRTKPCWPGTWDERAATMLRKDLEAAGIPYQDEAGRYFDFHALRHHFITNLAKQGIHPSVAQKLARHSTIELTMNNYTHVELEEMAKALEGTVDEEPARLDPELVHQLDQTPDSGGHGLSTGDTSMHNSDEVEVGCKLSEAEALDTDDHRVALEDTGDAEQVETVGHSIRNPTLYPAELRGHGVTATEHPR